MNLITFSTANEKQAHAWNCVRGISAVDAAAHLHIDFARGFIRAEVISFENFVMCGGEAGARDKGLLRVVGRSYVVKDGDIVRVRSRV